MPAAPAQPVVDVWRVDLGAAPEPQERRSAGRRAVRRVLAGYGDVDPEAIVFAAGPHGKPSVTRPAVRFNVTHTGTLLLVAVSADRDVGIDAERVRPRANVVGLARRWLTPDAVAALAAAPEAERLALFHRLWVRREALVKCHGVGLGGGPVPDTPVTVVDLDVAPDVPAALAAAGLAPVVPRELAWGADL